MLFEASPVGAEWLDDNVPCTRACPVLTNAGRYVSAIAAGDDELAYLIARMPNPFPSICGRVCAAPCEAACRRGDIDQPIAIRALKRFACEHGGVESVHAERLWREAVEMMPSRDERPLGRAVCGHLQRRLLRRAGNLVEPDGGLEPDPFERAGQCVVGEHGEV